MWTPASKQPSYVVACWRLLSPLGVLYYVRDTAALTDFGVMIKNDNPNYKHFNLEHLVGAADGNCSDPKHVYGWQRLHAMYKHSAWDASSGRPCPVAPMVCLALSTHMSSHVFVDLVS